MEEVTHADPHFNWTKLIPGVGHDYPHVATALIVALILCVFSILAYLSLKKAKQDVRPATTVSIRGISEVLVEFIVNLVDSTMGKQHRNMAPLFGSLFFFIFIANLAGVLPGMTPATDNYNTTLAIGVFSFLTYNYLGIKEHGAGYLKHFLGPVIWLAPLMVVIELISHLVRPMSLGFRLMGNMQGDHAVTGAFLNLVPLLVPIPFYALALFVCFIQAFVFTLLSMVYVSMATEHDH